MFSQLIILIILILSNAFFAATEIAFISLNDAKIDKQAKEGNKKAKQIQKMLKTPSKFLATIQIGITLAGFLSSAFASVKSFEFKANSNILDIPSNDDNIVEEIEDFAPIRNTEPKVVSEAISILDNNTFKTIGSVFDTYIIIEKDGKLLFMDQHAGHEKILFDKFKSELENKEVAVQPLLIPHILDLNYTESAFIEQNIQVFKELGFDMEEFGNNSYKVTTVPVLFDDVDIADFFERMLGDLDNKLVLNKSDTIREYLAKIACKSAIKGNHTLKSDEIKLLVNEIVDGHVLLCPHGRPIFVEVSQKEIEKWFKRIV